MNRAGFAMSGMSELFLFEISKQLSDGIFLFLFYFIALALYEYVVTFSQEVTTVWQRRKTATSILLVATRWTMVLNAVVILIESPKEVSRCVPRSMRNVLTSVDPLGVRLLYRI